MSNWHFGKRLALAFGACALGLIIVAVAGYQNTQQLIANDRWVAHTESVRTRIALLLGLLAEAESSQRGFLLSNDESHLAPYREALPHVQKTLEELSAFTRDNPARQAELAGLRSLIDQRVAQLARLIELRRTQGREPSAAQLPLGQGAQIMNEIRARIRAMDADEARLLQVRNEIAQSYAARATSVIIWGSVVALALIVAAWVIVSRALTRQVGLVVRHIQSSSTELQAAAAQQATGATEQSTAMNEVTTTISELLATSRQIAESAERVVHIAERTAESARAGDSRVERGNESVGGIRQQVDLIVGHMLELGRKSQQIGSVLDIVMELAEQTNILAINAR